MHDLDDRDLEILELLLENARRPYSEIADKVGVSPPTVSDRIDRLEDLGVIRRFTLELDRGHLDDGIPVLVDLSVRAEATEDVADRVADCNAVEHVYVTADGSVVAHAMVPEDDVQSVVTDVAGLDGVTDHDVRLLTRNEWTPDLSGSAFALRCDECDDPVRSRGETVREDGELLAFCSSACRQAFEQEIEAVAAE